MCMSIIKYIISIWHVFFVSLEHVLYAVFNYTHRTGPTPTGPRMAPQQRAILAPQPP